ncbi:MAG: sulfite exporter TauE/SafE family protein [Bacteroidetes bacterium]|nr:sulfite exporter TauE/SafE family protein [Bacteroidota bacterium]MBU1579503.1 sulfite exporter TauE/SafE family protein [Bacteroidota bacterium]MBU2558850.1 sulfite exporter TauE/SafE family protein [Bacteroidota bacterium]
MIDLYTALTIGLIGSFHCIGMCGPIAVALPVGNKTTFGKFNGVLLYNLGRSVTYGILGALFGLLGKGIEMAGFQQWASILLGVVMISTVLFPFLFHGKLRIDQLLTGYAGRLIANFRKLFGKSSYKNLLIIGLLNGLLPCGLVYVAVAGAINTNSVANGIAFMFVFGLGTIPVMMSVTLLGNIISQRFRKQMNHVIPVFIVVLGIVFILRGLSLGIPYISPKSQMLTPDKEMKVKDSCCSPKKTTEFKMN